MKLNPEILKTAADTIEKQASEIAALKGQVAQAKVAADKAVAQAKAEAKVAADKPTADYAAVVKVAADKLLERKLITTEANRDAFIAKCASDHKFALEQLVKLASLQAPALKRLGAADEAAAPAPAVNVSEAKWAAAHARFKSA